MNDKLRACALCAGKMEPGTTTFTVDIDYGVVVVREVPAIVCTQCGEAWIDDSIAEQLERIVGDARGRHAMVEVTTWREIAA